MADKPQGLVLTLGGAPPTPHTVEGLPGLYSPDRPTPVGGIGEPTLTQAKAADKAPGVPVRLVAISPKDLQRLRVQSDADRRAEYGLPPREKE